MLVPGVTVGLKPSGFCCSSDVPSDVTQKNTSVFSGTPGKVTWVGATVPVAVGDAQSPVVDAKAAEMPLNRPDTVTVAVSVVASVLSEPLGLSTGYVLVESCS